MKEALQALLAQALPQPGVAAWGARLADRSVASQCYSDWFAPAQIEHTLARLALMTESLRVHRIEAVRLCWVFEHARILFALRPDGACLGVFLENRPGSASAEVEALLHQFARLPAS